MINQCSLKTGDIAEKLSLLFVLFVFVSKSGANQYLSFHVTINIFR